MLAAYDIPVGAHATAASVAEAVAGRRARIGFPVALKILSPDITHKSDVGGVALGLADEPQLQAAAEAMLARVASGAAAGADHGLHRAADDPPPARAGADRRRVGRPQFGPVLLFGQGGTAVEVIARHARSPCRRSTCASPTT